MKSRHLGAVILLVLAVVGLLVARALLPSREVPGAPPATAEYLERAKRLADRGVRLRAPERGAAYHVGRPPGPSTAAARIGADLVVLELAMLRTDLAAVRGAALRVAAALPAIEDTRGLGVRYARLGEAAEAGGSVDAWRELPRETARRLAERNLEAPASFGAWARLGQLGARLEATEARAVREAIDGAPFVPRVHATLLEIERLLAIESPSTAEARALREGFDELLRRLS